MPPEATRPSPSGRLLLRLCSALALWPVAPVQLCTLPHSPPLANLCPRILPTPPEANPARLQISARFCGHLVVHKPQPPPPLATRQPWPAARRRAENIGRPLPFDAIVESSAVVWPLVRLFACPPRLYHPTIPTSSNSIASWAPPATCRHTPSCEKASPPSTTQERKKKKKGGPRAHSPIRLALK
jgi:hypothetical protein